MAQLDNAQATVHDGIPFLCRPDYGYQGECFLCRDNVKLWTGTCTCGAKVCEGCLPAQGQKWICALCQQERGETIQVRNAAASIDVRG